MGQALRQTGEHTPPTSSERSDLADEQRTAWLVCALILLAGVCFLHREVLFAGQIYHMDDAADGYYPSHAAIWRAVKSGQLPAWERSVWCGFPLLADPYYGALYPLTAVFFALGAARGLGFTIALHTFFGGLGMLLLLRRRGLAPAPSLLGAAALCFSSFMVERIRHIIFPEVLAWLPYVLLGVEAFLSGGTRWALPLIAGALGMLFLCGGLPLLPFVALILLSYGVPRLVRVSLAHDRLRPGLAPPLGRAVFWLGVAAICGVLIGMAQVLPTLSHLPQSPRSLSTDYNFASSYAWPRLSYVGTLLLPNLFGREGRGQWLGAYNHWEMAGYYVGALAVLLAPFGVLRRRAELWGLLLVALLAVALAFGDASPVHRFFFYHVPLYGALRCPTRSLVMFLFAVPVLAAEGLTFILAASPVRRGVSWPRIALFVGLFAAAGLGGWRLWRLIPGQVPLLRPFLRWDLGHLYMVLGTGGVVLALQRLGRLPPRVTGWLIAGLSLVDVVSMSRLYVQPQPSDFATGTERFAAVDHLMAQSPQDRYAPEAYGPFRLLNLGLTYGLESAAGYDSFTIWRYVHYLYILNNGATYPYAQLKHDPAAGYIKRFDSPLVDLLNIRWVTAQSPPAPGWIERFAPRPGDPPHARHESAWDARIRLYENPHPLPRAFIVYKAQVLPEEKAQAQALLTLDPRRTVILDRAPVPAPDGGERPLVPAPLVRAERYRLVISADTPAAGVLVVSETSYPGWTATVDGQPAPLLHADYAFRGVALPAGRHIVEMRFRSRPLELGLLLSGLGLLLLGGLWRRRV